MNRLIDIIKYEFDKQSSGTLYLLALSGGIDSTSLFHIMLQLDLNFQVAHANFGLRGEDSMDDEIFVQQLCENNDIVFHVKKFDTLNYVKNNNDSIQSAARKLRYEWFEQILKNNHLDKIVTAHTLNDSVETFFINLLRGTGIKGLLGIQNSTMLLRPMLQIKKKEIIKYARNANIIWREDESNAKDDYIRNKIRHHIIPEFESIDSKFLNQFDHTTRNLTYDVDIINQYMSDLRNNLIIYADDIIEFPISKLKSISNPNIILYLFKPYGFEHPQEILKLIYGKESSEIQSKKYRLIKSRSVLQLTTFSNVSKEKFIINQLGYVEKPIKLQFNLLENEPPSLKGLLDLEKVKFPLSLRLRKNGDIFYPEGMGGHSKKLSKFYKDNKFSKLEKESTWLLCDANDHIIGVVGHRWDERFIATKQTKKWLQIEKLD